MVGHVYGGGGDAWPSEGLPIAVGGNHMLTTASYEARKYGVRSAMPGFIAKQLCPELIIVPTHFDKYQYP